MSLYDTLQKTKQELPYRFQRLQNEANAKRAETVTPNTNQVSREQGIRDSYRKRVEQEQQAKDNLEKAIQMTVGGYNISPGSSLIQKAVQNTIGQDISRDYFKQAVGDETTIGGVLQKQIDILGDQISKRQNELNERLAEETVSGEPILDPLRNQITSMSQQWRDTKDKLKMLNQLESAMNSSYEQQELLSPDEYKSQVQDLQKQIDTLMEQERVWQDAQYSNALGMEYLGGNVPAQSVQSEIDKLVAQRDKLNALIPEAESVQWENKMKDEILAAGGEDLLRQIMELSRQKQEQEYDNSNYTDYKNAVDALKAQGYDQKTLNDWFAYAERIRNREEYQKSMEWAQSFAQEHPVASSIVSVPINLVSGVGALDVLGQNITKNFTGRPVDYRTPAMQFSGEANTIRGQVSSDIADKTEDWALGDTKFGNAYSTGYQLLMSMADSLGAAGLSAVGVPFSGALLGGSAATNAITEARGRGASDGQAIVYGLMAGVAETLFESLSIESLVKLDDPSTVRAAILNILKQGGVEASEELNTSIANTMSDLLVMGPKSQLLTDKRNYLDNGFSQKEASRLAMSNWFNGLMGDALGGFLSGGMMSAFSRPIQSLGQYRNQNNNALDAAIQETMKPTQELNNLNNAIDGLFAQNKTAQADTGAESTNVNTNPDSMPKVTMADFTDRLSAVFNNLEYGDTKTQTEITQKTHQDMVSSGEVVKIPESTLEQTESYYPDLRGMKKQERAPILKQKITELKTVLRKFLNGMKGGTYEFEVNGNILEAKLYDTGVREVMDKITQNKASMLLHSEEVFKNARYLYSTPDYEGDPNIYRWNYFYTPVDIGGETVGVRIAVRDIALGQNNIPESQIYNWNIKKDAALGGEKLGTNAASPDTSSAASDNNSIRGNSENVNGKSNMEQAVDALFPGMEGDVGDMGAKTSDFEHKVKESQTAQNTIGKNEARWNVPEDQRVNQQYDAVTEQESLNNARMRIEQDLPGEQEALRRAAVWSNEEVDMGMLILGGLRQKAKETGDWTDYKDWAEVVKQHGVASGQGLQAWAKYTRRTGDGIMQTVADILKNSKNGTDVNDVLETASHYADRFDGAVAEKSVSDLVSIIQDTAVTRKTKRSWGKKLGGEIDWALNRIADYADAEVRAAMNQEGDGNFQNYEFLRDFAAASIEDIAGDHVKTSLGKMALTVRRMAMLSKAATVMRNLVGNEGFDLVDTLARNISVPLDMLLSKVTGTRSVAFDRGTLSKTGVKGQLDGLAKALLEVGLDVNAGGASSKYENSANRTFKMSGNVVSKLFSTWEKYMGYALNVTDEMKKGSVDARVQKGLDKLYEQGKIKDDSLRSGGQQEALYRTFQDKTRLSDMSLKGRNALNVWNVGDAGLGDVLVPFAQVPANLADRAIDYSPAGLVESTVNLSKVLLKAKKGTLTAAEQAQAVQNLGRNITGSALIAIAAGLASNGFIRVVNPGGEDENKDKAAFEKMQGQSGTQFNVSAFLRSQNGGSADWQDGDTLVSIAFLEPFNAHLTIGALLAEDMKEEGQLTANTIAKDTFTGSLTAILDLPMFEKFRDVSDAYTYSTKERSGEKLLDSVNTLAANEVGSLIPNSVKGIAQGLDPYQRDLYSRDDAWGQAADQFRAVFDRDSLPIKQDSLGRDMMNEGGFLNFLNSNILPGQITTYKTDELLDKITDLSALTGKASVYPSRKAPDKITVDGEDVLLNQEQQRQYQSTYGQTEYETRSALIENSLYDNLTPQEEIKAHSFAEDYAKQVAKSDINADFEPDSWVEDLKGKTPAEVADAIMLKTFQSMAEDEKNYDSKYDGITDMLDSGTIDEAMAVSLLPKEANDGYYKHIKGSGIELSTFIDVYQFKNNAKSDKDKDGKTTKSAQEKVIDYIDKVVKGPGQKRRMFLAMGYSEKNLPEGW